MRKQSVHKLTNLDPSTTTMLEKPIGTNEEDTILLHQLTVKLLNHETKFVKLCEYQRTDRATKRKR